MSTKHLFVLQEINTTDNLIGTFYVIDHFPYPQFVLDEYGNVQAFDTYEAAKKEAGDCQEGYVICFD